MSDFAAKAARALAEKHALEAKFLQDQTEYAQRQAAILRSFLEAAANTPPKVAAEPVYRLADETITAQPIAHRYRGRKLTPARPGTVQWKFEAIASGWRIASHYPSADGSQSYRHPSECDVLSADGRMIGCVALRVPSMIRAGAHHISLRESIARRPLWSHLEIDCFESPEQERLSLESNRELLLAVQTSGLAHGADGHVLVAREKPVSLGTRPVLGTSHSSHPDHGIAELERTLIADLTGVWT